MGTLYGNPKHLIPEEDARAALAAHDRLAIIVTHGPNGLSATHAPVAVEDGKLISHVSRGNPQWKDAPCDVMVIAPGPETYISPSWYETKKRDQRAVPTWNYEAIHVWGKLRLIDDKARLRDIVDKLSQRHENNRPDPWAIEDAPEEYIDRLLSFIVGFEITLDRVEGKRKLSQEKPDDDQAGVLAALETSEDPRDRAIAARMRALRGA